MADVKYKVVTYHMSESVYKFIKTLSNL